MGAKGDVPPPHGTVVRSYTVWGRTPDALVEMRGVTVYQVAAATRSPEPHTFMHSGDLSSEYFCWSCPGRPPNPCGGRSCPFFWVRCRNRVLLNTQLGMRCKIQVTGSIKCLSYQTQAQIKPSHTASIQAVASPHAHAQNPITPRSTLPSDTRQ